jgi:hypothetical protein
MYKIFTFHMLNMLKNVYTILSFCQSRLSTTDFALFLVASATMAV